MESQEENNFVKIGDNTVPPESVYVGGNLKVSADDIKLGSDNAGVQMNTSKPVQEPSVEMETEENDIVGNLPVSQSEINTESVDIIMGSHVTDSESTLGIRNIFSSTLNESLLNQSSAQLSFTMNTSNISQHNSPSIVSNKTTASLPDSDLTPKKINIGKSVEVPLDGNIETNSKSFNPLTLVNNVFYQDKNDATPIQLTKRQKFSLSPFVQNNQLNMSQSVTSAQNQSINDSITNLTIGVNKSNESSQSVSRKNLFESSNTAAIGGSNMPEITSSTDDIGPLNNVKGEPSFLPLDSVMEIEKPFSTINISNTELPNKSLMCNAEEYSINKSVIDTAEPIDDTSQTDLEQLRSTDEVSSEATVSIVNVSNVNPGENIEKNISKVNLSLNNDEMLPEEGITNINPISEVIDNTQANLSLNNTEVSMSQPEMAPNVSMPTSIEDSTSPQILNASPEGGESLSSTAIKANLQNDSDLSAGEHVSEASTFVVDLENNSGNRQSIPNGSVLNFSEKVDSLQNTINENTFQITPLVDGSNVNEDGHLPQPETSLNTSVLNSPMGINILYKSSNDESHNTSLVRQIENDEAKIVPESDVSLGGFKPHDVEVASQIIYTSETSMDNAMPKDETSFNISVSNSIEVHNYEFTIENTPDIDNSETNIDKTAKEVLNSSSGNNQVPESTIEGASKTDLTSSINSFVPFEGNGVESILTESSIELSEGNVDKLVPKAEISPNHSLLEASMGIDKLCSNVNENSHGAMTSQNTSLVDNVETNSVSKSNLSFSCTPPNDSRRFRELTEMKSQNISIDASKTNADIDSPMVEISLSGSTLDFSMGINQLNRSTNGGTPNVDVTSQNIDIVEISLLDSSKVINSKKEDIADVEMTDTSVFIDLAKSNSVEENEMLLSGSAIKLSIETNQLKEFTTKGISDIDMESQNTNLVSAEVNKDAILKDEISLNNSTLNSTLGINQLYTSMTEVASDVDVSLINRFFVPLEDKGDKSLLKTEMSYNSSALMENSIMEINQHCNTTIESTPSVKQNATLIPPEGDVDKNVLKTEISLESSVLNTSMGINHLHKSTIECTPDIDMLVQNASHVLPEDNGNKSLKADVSLNSSTLNSSMGINHLHQSTIECTPDIDMLVQNASHVLPEDNGDRSFKADVSLNSSTLNSSMGINHLHQSTIECLPDVDNLVQIASHVLPEDNGDRSFKADVSLNSSTLNSSMGINHLHQSTIECLPDVDNLVQIASHVLPEDNGDRSFKADVSLNSSTLNSSMGINHLNKSTIECLPDVDNLVQIASHVLPEDNGDKSLKADVSFNSSTLNSSMGINHLHQATIECTPDMDMMVQNASHVLPEDNGDKSFKADVSLNSSTLNSSMGINHLHKSTTVCSPDVDKREVSLNSTMGINQLYESISEGTPEVELSPQNDSFVLSDGNDDQTILKVDETLNCLALNSSMKLSKINESISESSQVVEIRSCTTSLADKSITCSEEKGNAADLPTEPGINATSQCPNLILAENNLGLDGANSNAASLDSTRQVDQLEQVVEPSNTLLSKDCEILECLVRNDGTEMDNSMQNITEAGSSLPESFKNSLVLSQSTLFDKSVNENSNQLFPASGENENEIQEEVIEKKLLESFSEKNPVAVTNETKYFFKDIDMTCVNNGGEYKPNEVTRSNLFDVNRSPGNFASDDMEVTIIKERNQGNLCNASVDEKSFNLNYSLDSIDEGAMEITTQNPGSSENFAFQKPFAQTKSSNPEVTILGEETILMCQSVIHDPDEILFEREAIKDQLSADPANSNRAEILDDQKSDDSPKEESVRFSVSLDETSMCALDYSLPLSDCTNLASKSLLSTKKEYYRLLNSTALLSLTRKSIGDLEKSTSEKDLSIKSINSVEGGSTPVKSANNSGLIWDSFFNERSCLPMRKSLNITNLTSEERRLLSETINKTVRSENLSPHDEIISLKENLFVVMDLLEKENSEFEAFKKACENEKSQLISKIGLLEEHIAEMKKDTYVNSDNDLKIAEDKLKEKEEELSEIMIRYNLTEENLKQTKKDLEYLRNLFFLTEAEIPQFSGLLSTLNSYGVSTEGVMMEGTENVIHLKNILNVLSSLLVKHNSLVLRYSELIENSKEDKSKLAALEEAVHSMGQREKDVVELQAKCIQLQSALEGNQNLVADLQSQLSSFNALKESLEKNKIESESMRENISKLKDELALSLERNSEASSKYEILTQELSESIRNYDFLQSDNKELLIKYEETSEKLINLEGIERKYFELEKQCESLETYKNEYDLLKEDFTKLKEELSLACKNNTEISSAFERLSDELRESNEKYEYLKIQNNDLLNNHEKTSEKLIKLEEMESKYIELEKHCESLESYKNDYDLIKEEFAKLKEELEFASRNNTEISSICERLSEELKVSNEKYESLKIENNDLFNNYEKTSERVISLEEIERKCIELEKYCESLETYKNDYGILKEEFLKLKEDLLFGENRHSEISSICERLNLELRESNEKYESLKIENSDLLRNYEKTSERLISLEEIERKYLELEKHCEFLEKCKNDHDLLKEEFSKLKEELEFVTKNNTEISSTCERLNEELRQSNEKYGSLKIENNDLLNNYEKTSERVINLEEIERKYLELEKHCEILEKYKNDHDLLKEEFSTLKKNFSISSEKNVELSSKCETLDKELTESIEQLDSIKKDKDEIFNKYEKCLEDLVHFKDLEKKYSELEKQCEFLESQKIEFDSLKEDFIKLKDELSLATDENSVISSKCEALTKELDESSERYQSLKNENDDLSCKYHKSKEDIANLEGIEKKFTELMKHCEDLTKNCKSFEDNLNGKVSQCEEFSKQNEHLQNEVHCLNVLLEETKKVTEQEAQGLREICFSLKNKFNQQSHSLDEKISEVDLLIEANDVIRSKIESMKDIIELNSEDSLLPTSELKSLLLQFEEVNLKFNMLDNVKIQLKHNYDEALERIKVLENNLALETESKNKHLEEISVLNTKITESSENLSELQRKYDSILSQSDSDSSRMACLVEEIEALKLNYNENLLNLAKLEEMCSEKTESNKLLEESIATLNLNIKENEESLALVKNQYETLASKYESESAEFKVLQNDHAILEKHYAEASTTIEDLQKLSSERADINEKNKIEIDSLLKEVNKLNENLLVVNEQFEDILSKYENEREKVSSLQSEMTSLLEKYEESSTAIEKLQQENKEKCEDSEKLEKDLANLTLELEETKENLSKLKVDYDVTLLNIKNECLKLESLEKEHSDLQIKCNSLIKEKDILEADYLQLMENNERNLSELECSESKLNQLTEELTNLRNDHNGVILKLETAVSELNSIQSEYSKLDTKYVETVIAKETLEKESAEKDLLCAKLEEERKLQSEEFTNLQTNFDILNSECGELKAKYDEKCSESDMLLSCKTEFESKYNDALTNTKELQEFCSSKSESNEKLSQEVSDLKIELATLRGDFESVDSKLKEVSTLYAEEQSNYETLKHDYDKLSSEFEEASTKIRNLESECLSSSANNQTLFEEVSKLKLEILNMSDSLSDLKTEYDELTIKHTNECTKHAELRTLFEGVEANYQESLMWVKEITKESLGVAWEEQDDLQTYESHYENFNSALSSIKMLKEQSSTNKEINENLQKEIRLLKEKSSASEIEIMALKKDYESLQNKFEEENSKCIILQEQLKDIEVKYTDTVSKLAALEEDISNKNLENGEIQSQNKDLKNDIIELTNNKIKLQEELKVLIEKSNSLDQECEDMKKEIEILREEKILREELERRNSNLQAQCGTLEEDLTVKIRNLERLESEYQSLEEKLNSERQSMLGENEQLNKRISELSDKVDHLTSDLQNLQLKNTCLEEDLEQKHSELRNAALKIENFQYYEELIQNIITDYPFFVEKYFENELTSENSIFDAFLPSVERVLKELSKVGDEYAANKSLLTQTQEEVEELRAEVKSLHESLQESQSKSSEVTASYDSLQEKFTILMETHTSMKESYECLSQQSDALTTENTGLKQLNQDLASQIEEKTHIVRNLQDVQQRYESLVATNNDVMSMLSEKSKENEDIKRALSENNQHLSKLKMELKKNLEELSILKEDKSTLKSEHDKCSLKIKNLTEDIEKLEAENKKIRTEKLKYEKEYQNVIDNLRKTQEEMCEVEKKCNEKMSRFTYVLKEKEDFENETLSLLKQNDELTSKIKSLTAKVEDYDKSYNKLQELQSAYSLLTKEKNVLETQVTELQKYKNEIIDLKANLAVKDSKINEILNEKKQMKINYQQKSDETQELVEKVCSLLPGVGGFTETLKAIEDKMNQINAIQDALADEKAKCESLDEECNVLNEDLKYKDQMMGDMYRDHSLELEKLKKSLEKAEETNKEQLSENDSLKEKLKNLEKDLEDVKSSQPSQCMDCVQLKETLQKAETDLTENRTKITSLENHLVQFQSSYKKKVGEYRKKLEALDQSLKKYKKSNEEKGAENEQFKEKVNALEKELTNLKSSGTAPCKNCTELTQVKTDLAERNTKITSLEKHLEHFQTSYKKKTGEYKKKILSLQQKLDSKEKKGDENQEPAKNPSLEAECQTEASPLQLTGHSGIVQSAKMKEQEEKLQKMEKENQILKKVCHNRLQTIRDMQAKYENRSPSVDALKKASRSVLSEVKNN